MILLKVRDNDVGNRELKVEGTMTTDILCTLDQLKKPVCFTRSQCSVKLFYIQT